MSACHHSSTTFYCVRLLVAVAVATVAVTTVSASVIDNALFEKHGKIIRDSFAETHLAEQDNSCSFSATENCNLNTLTPDASNLVFPGSSTRCIFSSSSAFSFQVIPGDSDKLLYYFQDGGACWDAISTITPVPLCRTDAAPYDLQGVFNRTNADNAFRTYTVVVVLYCSGDIHGGNVTRPYNDKDGVPVTQTGLANAQSVLEWTVAQQKQGFLASKLTDLVVMGSSAGSIGAQLWSNAVLNALSWKNAAVIPDSFVAFFPPGTQGPLIKSFGMCTDSLFNDDLKAICEKGDLTLQDIVPQFASLHPTVPFSFIQSKVDAVQYSYYMAVALTSLVNPLISPSHFYGNCSAILSTYSQDKKNVLVYLVDGVMHTFTELFVYYTADALGPLNNGHPGVGPSVADWVGQFPLNKGKFAASVCVGARQDPSSVVVVDGDVDGDDLKKLNYCSTDIVPKVFVQL